MIKPYKILFPLSLNSLTFWVDKSCSLVFSPKLREWQHCVYSWTLLKHRTLIIAREWISISPSSYCYPLENIFLILFLHFSTLHQKKLLKFCVIISCIVSSLHEHRKIVSLFRLKNSEYYLQLLYFLSKDIGVSYPDAVSCG